MRYDYCRNITTLSAAQAIGNAVVVPQSLEAAVEEVAIPALTAEGEDKFDTIASAGF